MFAMKESKLTRAEKSQRIAEELKTIGLYDRVKSRVYELSGGEQQRISLVRAVLKEHTIILADEPTGNLDKANSKIVMEHLKALNEQGKTIIIVSHDISVKSYAKTILNL